MSSNGTVAPGNSIGTLSVARDVTLGAGGAYGVELDPNGASDRVAAGGVGFLPAPVSYGGLNYWRVSVIRARLEKQFGDEAAAELERPARGIDARVGRHDRGTSSAELP